MVGAIVSRRVVGTGESSAEVVRPTTMEFRHLAPCEKGNWGRSRTRQEKASVVLLILL